jgi:hypothetical protein
VADGHPGSSRRSNAPTGCIRARRARAWPSTPTATSLLPKGRTR